MRRPTSTFTEARRSSGARPTNLLESGPKGPLVGFFLPLSDAKGIRTWPESAPSGNSSCTSAVKLAGMDLTLEGEASVVTDRETLEEVAAIYRELGWPAEVEHDAFSAPFSAPSAGPPPWQLYRFAFSSVVGLSPVEPNGTTR